MDSIAWTCDIWSLSAGWFSQGGSQSSELFSQETRPEAFSNSPKRREPGRSACSKGNGGMHDALSC